MENKEKVFIIKESLAKSVIEFLSLAIHQRPVIQVNQLITAIAKLPQATPVENKESTAPKESTDEL